MVHSNCSCLWLRENKNQSSKTMKKLKTALYYYNHPEKCHYILKALSEICIKFLIAQQKSGAQVLQVFESVAVEGLTQEQYFIELVLGLEMNGSRLIFHLKSSKFNG